MFEKFFRTQKDKKEIRLKTLAFFQFSKSIGAVTIQNLEDVSISELLSSAYEFLEKERIVTQKQEKKLLIFMDQYNRFLEYCVEMKVVKKEQFLKVCQLRLTKVPDMSRIKVPNISKELKQMDIDLKSMAEIFSRMDFKK